MFSDGEMINLSKSSEEDTDYIWLVRRRMCLVLRLDIHGTVRKFFLAAVTPDKA